MASGQLRQAAVIGLPDEWLGQKLHAVAVSLGAADPEAILRQVAASLPAYMVPQRIEFVDNLPVTPNGKVDYKRLVAERLP
jgi:acyl-CoA synthetase (AMP-forming)/AMP-acid ligase II